MTTERIEVQRPIAAAPAAIFDILCTPSGHVAIDASGMLMAASGEPAVKEGDRFVVHMDRESLQDYPLGEYDVTVVITTFDQDREIAWKVEGVIKPWIGHVYGYRFDEIDGGTLVTSYYDWSNIHPDYRGSGLFPVVSEANQRATLGILARTVAPGAGRPGAAG
jgi:hypothetical protein